MQRTIFFFIFLLVMGCGEKTPINIYESDEFKNLSKEDIIVGESIWVTTCFRCHMYGTLGAAPVKDKEHFDKLAAKGFDKLYESVLNGMDGEEGVMPPKGTCYSCSEEEIKKSIYYIFHLAKKVQDEIAQKEKSPG
jgi:cytochrome c5|tara:strand:- start:1216 stop:1623 length:408 start_codon:yes stop_codon:yes gene_type:complete